jgi:cyclopropane fatty-acyl-phospholipid synthase-like methyltransferase
MKNYDRYRDTTSEQYSKKTVMSYFCRMPSDRNIFPLLETIRNKNILDIGLGAGYYSRFLIPKNTVTGIDQNPHLCKLPIKVYKGDATELVKLTTPQKFDVVFSTWMTEYLNQQQLQQFFSESKKVLKENGQLITTIVSVYGFGWFYITMAKKIRKINKYNYTRRQITELLKSAGFTNIQITNLNSWLAIPWAYMATAQ